MKKMLLINIILSGLLALIVFTSGKSVTVSNITEYRHHHKEVLGYFVLVPEAYREYNDVGGYSVCYCPEGLYFNCLKIVCDFPESGCGCAN